MTPGLYKGQVAEQPHESIPANSRLYVKTHDGRPSGKQQDLSGTSQWWDECVKLSKARCKVVLFAATRSHNQACPASYRIQAFHPTSAQAIQA